MFTSDILKKLAPSVQDDVAAQVVASLEQHAAEFGLGSVRRAAHFIAQTCHESEGFTRFVENLSYSAERIAAVWPRLKERAAELAHQPEKLANAAYGGRLGNGAEASGDGWKYRGRGPIMITGLDNYRDRSVGSGLALVAEPDLAAEPASGMIVALDYWRARGCNQAADMDDVAKVTRLVNGPGMIGLPERARLTALAKQLLTPDEPLVA